MSRKNIFSKSWYQAMRDLDQIGYPCMCDLLDKETGCSDYIDYMLDRTLNIFEWSGFPDTVPAYIVERYLQTLGYIALAEVNGAIYPLYGRLGGERDAYYRPRHYIGANPWLNVSYDFLINEECALIKNDTQLMGMIPLFSRYATQLVENDISIRSAQINLRSKLIISAASDSEVASAQEYIDKLERGQIGVIAEKPFLEGVKTLQVTPAAPNAIIQLIELTQYLKASWFNEVGLNASFNMKREYVSAEEIKSNDQALLPLIDDMLRCREDACEYINQLFGLNVSVKKNSAWENKDIEATYGLGGEENKLDTSQEVPAE